MDGCCPEFGDEKAVVRVVMVVGRRLEGRKKAVGLEWLVVAVVVWARERVLGWRRKALLLYCTWLVWRDRHFE